MKNTRDASPKLMSIEEQNHLNNLELKKGFLEELKKLVYYSDEKSILIDRMKFKKIKKELDQKKDYNSFNNIIKSINKKFTVLGKNSKNVKNMRFFEEGNSEHYFNILNIYRYFFSNKFIGNKILDDLNINDNEKNTYSNIYTNETNLDTHTDNKENKIKLLNDSIKIYNEKHNILNIQKNSSFSDVRDNFEKYEDLVINNVNYIESENKRFFRLKILKNINSLKINKNIKENQKSNNKLENSSNINKLSEKNFFNFNYEGDVINSIIERKNSFSIQNKKQFKSNKISDCPTQNNSEKFLLQKSILKKESKLLPQINPRNKKTETDNNEEIDKTYNYQNSIMITLNKQNLPKLTEKGLKKSKKLFGNLSENFIFNFKSKSKERIKKHHHKNLFLNIDD